MDERLKDLLERVKCSGSLPDISLSERHELVNLVYEMVNQSPSRHQEFCFNFAADETVDCRIAENGHNAGDTGQYFGWLTVNDEKWVVVLLDGDKDPCMYPAEQVFVAIGRWERVSENT